MNDIDTTVVMITWSPTEKRFAVLQKSFGSLKDHTCRPHILTVVDNGPKSQTDWLANQEIDIHIVNEVNQGVGKARNQGAEATKTKYIAFVDNDLLFFSGWLRACIAALEEHEDLPLIATPRKTSPMKYKKFFRGQLGEYQLWSRCAGMALVMRRSDYDRLGHWNTGSQPGGKFCDTARRNGYRFIWHPTWLTRHLCKRPCYDHQKTLINGEWVSPKKE